jgi:hypothetical protein
MSDPHLISILTNEYLMLAAGDPPTPPDAPIAGDSEPGDVSGLSIIVDADELFSRIEPQLDSSDFYLLMLNGQQGSGKSTIARELSHHAHTVGYKTLYSSGFDIIDAPEKFVREAEGADKVCIILDDMSYIMSATSSRTQSKIKSFFALIRHALKAKIFVIVISHFTTAVPPIFKNSNVWIYSHPTTQEYDGMVKIIGTDKKAKQGLHRMFKSVMDIQAAAQRNHVIPLNLGGRDYSFVWGDKSNSGDGRLMLMLMDGEALVYNSTDTYCDVCKGIGFGVKLNMEDYLSKRPGKEKEGKASD